MCDVWQTPYLSVPMSPAIKEEKNSNLIELSRAMNNSDAMCLFNKYSNEMSPEGVAQWSLFRTIPDF